MSIKALGMYGGFFLGMLLLALFVTGVFQQAILPRLSRPAAGEGAGSQEASTEDKAQLGATGPTVGVSAEPAPTVEATAATSDPPRDAAAAAAPSGGPRDAAATGAGAQVRRLARMYEGMRPKEAASVLEKLERPLAARVLTEIKERQASKILGAMNPSTAAELSRLLGDVMEKSS